MFFTVYSLSPLPERGRARQIIDGAPNGRLLRFEPSTGDLHTVMCGLHFPNGVEVLSCLVLELASHLFLARTYLSTESTLLSGIYTIYRDNAGYHTPVLAYV